MTDLTPVQQIDLEERIAILLENTDMTDQEAYEKASAEIWRFFNEDGGLAT